MNIGSDYIRQIESDLASNTASRVRSAESSLIEILKKVIIEEKVVIEEEEIESLADYNNWVKNKVFKSYDSKTLLEIMSR